MKKIKIAILISTVLIGKLFCQTPSINIGDKQFKVEKAYEFNSTYEVRREWIPNLCITNTKFNFCNFSTSHHPEAITNEIQWVYFEEYYEAMWGDKDFIGIPKKHNASIIKYSWSPDSYSVSDGVLTLVSSAIKSQGKNGPEYTFLEPTFVSGSRDMRDKNMGSKNPYFFKTEDKTHIIEFRAKLPSDSIRLTDLYLLSTGSRFSDGSDFDNPECINSKGNIFSEVDLFEFQSAGKVARHFGENTVSFLGNTIYQKFSDGKTLNNEKFYLFDQEDNNNQAEAFKNGKKYSSETILGIVDVGDVKKWCEEFHVFTYVLSPTSLACYLDGVQYKYIEWGEELGPIPPNQTWNIQIHSLLSADFIGSTEWKDDYEEFKIDYIRVFEEIK